ncbi:hypothetical protein NUU61_007417 [Penicillium alfredii]|uniref:Zn(2)-C6 fungal-type domain-containing protein n=1 Tax=Penicillium alfredii TaxID=1506179 RepID=A0A9W9F2R1_9EURO|nr:uncharacterized protein NUU61_007417 [Penicillium alfredii]KAJ5092547.1 hypothetical protein NUU61_007417 [Penicillium alfredii]
MKVSRYISSRQKSCQQCSNSKTKCDRKQGRCTRCTQRNLSCVYPRSNPSESTRLESSISDGGTFVSTSRPDASFPGPNSDLSINAESTNPTLPEHIVDTQTIINDAGSVMSSIPSISTPESRLLRHLGSSSLGEVPEKPDIFNFSRLDLICPINVDDISNRWLNPYISGAEPAIKKYPATVTRFIYRVLKSYAAVAARGRATLPFIHPTQMKEPRTHLATCLSLVRISVNPLPGSEDAAVIVLQREMENIAKEHTNYDDMSLLAAFQAYLIYTMILFFRLSQGTSPFFRGAMMTLQEVASLSSRRGLVCTADAAHTRPRWEEWIVAEAKRRTLYVMYLFDSVLSAHENLPTFLGTELRGLPAPSNKSLWQACSRSDWEKEYNIFLAEWTEKSLTIDELWPIPPELADVDIVRKRRRIDQWLENVDEFGTMIFAVTGCTHGC